MLAIASLVGLAVLAPLLVTPILPQIDLYNHLARFHILAHIEGDPFLATDYAENWRLLPNVGFDYLAVPLVGLVPPLLLAKLIVGLIVLVQFGGVLALNRALTGRISAWTVLLAAGLAWSCPMGSGFINYLLGAGLALWGLATWIRLRARPVLATAVCATIATGILLVHGFAFALYGLMLGGIELGLWFARADRRLGDLVRGAALLCLQAVLPVILFLNTPTAGSTSQDGSLVQRMQQIGGSTKLADRLAAQVLNRTENIYRVAETTWPLVDLALFAGTLALLVWALRKGVLRIAPVAWPALAIAALLVAFMPGTLFSAGHLHERMPLLFGTIFAAALVVKAPSRALRLLAALTALRLAALIAGWSAYRQHYADFREVTARLPAHSLLASELVRGNDLRDGLAPRCQIYAPLAAIERNVATVLFTDPTQQPMVAHGRLLALMQSLPPPSGEEHAAIRMGRRPFHYDDELAAIAAGRRADFVLICGEAWLKRPLPANLERVARRGFLSLYRIR